MPLHQTKGGFFIHHQRGSHARLKHSIKRNLSVTVPVHSKDLSQKTLRRIIKQTNLGEADFLKLISD